MNRLKTYLWLSMLGMAACSSSSDTETALAVSFQMQAEPGNPNFITLTAAGEEGDTYVWTSPEAGITATGRSVTCYFERKGTYEVTLTRTSGGLKGSETRTLTVSDDARYYRQGEQLWWHDEFEGTRLDNTAWNYDTGTGKWGNNEWQNYTSKAENSFLRDGMLVLRAVKSGAGQQEGDYTSARLTTRGKKEISRGRVEVRAKLPGGTGLWPAIWMYGTKAQPYYSELDIMEYVGYDKNIIYGAVHTSATLDGTAAKVSESKVVNDVEEAFHVYGMNWTDHRIEYYLDSPENVYLTFTPADADDPRQWPFDSELYLILNIAVGGDWGGMRGVDDSIFPREMEVDYVRIFKKNGI